MKTRSALNFTTFQKKTVTFEKGFDMKKALKAIFEFFALLIGADCEARRKAADDGICDFGGQGRDKYGR